MQTIPATYERPSMTVARATNRNKSNGKCARDKFELYKVAAFSEMAIIKKHVYKICGVTPNYADSETRKIGAVRARQLAMYFMYKNSKPGWTLEKIGKMVNRDHSSVLYTIKQIENWIETDKLFAKKVNEIEKYLNANIN